MHEGLFYFFYFIINQESTFRESVVHNGSRNHTFSEFLCDIFSKRTLFGGCNEEGVIRGVVFKH